MARITASRVAPPRRGRRAPVPPVTAVVAGKPTPVVGQTTLPTTTVEGKEFYDLASVAENPELQQLFISTVPGGEKILKDYTELASLPTVTQEGKTYYDLAKISADSALSEIFGRRISEGTKTLTSYAAAVARSRPPEAVLLTSEQVAMMNELPADIISYYNRIGMLQGSISQIVLNRGQVDRINEIWATYGTLRPQFAQLHKQWQELSIRLIQMFDPSYSAEIRRTRAEEPFPGSPTARAYDSKMYATTDNIELYFRLNAEYFPGTKQIGHRDQDGNLVPIGVTASNFMRNPDGSNTEAWQKILDNPELLSEFRTLTQQNEFTATQMHNASQGIVNIYGTIVAIMETRSLYPESPEVDTYLTKVDEQLSRLIEVAPDMLNYATVELAQFITADGNFDLPKAIAAGIPVSVLTAIGFTEENLAQANALNDILAILPEGITSVTAINAAIQAGLVEQLKILGITDKQMSDAQVIEQLILAGIYRPDTGNIDILGAIAAGIPASYLGVLGVTAENFNEAVTFFKANVQLATGEWLPKIDVDAIKAATPELHTILMSKGYEAYTAAFDQAYTKIGDKSFISNVELEKVRQDSQELYDLLLSQGFDAYSAEIDRLNDERQEFLATHLQIASGEWFPKADLTAIQEESPQLYTLLIDQGYDAYIKEIDRLESEYQAQLVVLRKLEEYRVIEGGRPAAAQPIVYDLALAVTRGFDLDQLKELFPAETVAQAVATADAMKLLAPYRNPDGSYNVTSFNTEHPGQLEQLATLGFVPTNSIMELNKLVSSGDMTQAQRGVLSQAIRRASLGSLQEYLVDILSDLGAPAGTRQKEWGELTAEQKRAVAANYYTTDLGAWKPLSEALKDVGIMMTPVYGTIYFWNEMDTAGRTLSVLMDIAVIALPFMRGIAGTAGRIIAPLSKQSKFFKVASNAGKTYRELQVALKNLRKVSITSKGYPSAASKVQKLAQASIRADRVFLEKLSYIERLSAGELRAIEKLSGFKGLKQIVMNLSKAHKRLEAVWKQLDRYPLGSPNYIRSLPRLEQARARLTRVLNQFETVAKPRYKQAPHTGWEKLISKLENELARAKKHHSRASASSNLSWLRDAKDQLAIAEINLAEARRLMKTGILPTTVKTRWKFRETIDVEGLLDELDLFYKGKGKYQPIKPKPATRGKIPVAVKEKLVVPSKLKATPRTRLAETMPELKPKAPKVAPRAKTSVFPGITPAIKISSATREDTIPLEVWGRMTIDQIRRLYGEQVMVSAIGVPLSISKLLPKGWVSPAEAVKAGNLVVSWAATQFAPAAALKPATLAAVKPTIGVITKPAVRALPGVRPAAEVAPLTGVIPAVAVATLAGVVPTAPAKVPVTPKRPVGVLPVVLPPVLTRLQTQSPTSQEIPAGSIAWAQGKRKGLRGRIVSQWYFIPPPYDQNKPISLSAPPMGAVRTGSNSPYDTIQVIGQSRTARVPKKVSVDLGWADIFVINGKKIQFKSGGEKTDVGTRLPSLTKGMSVDEDVAPFELAPARKGVSRPDTSKKKPKRKKRKKGLTAYEYMTTLKRFTP